MTDILMPALSPTMEEGLLAKWFVAVGDSVKAGDILAEIETDKASMEVEAVDDGVVGALLVAAGTEGVKINTPIARLEPAGSSAAATTPAPPVLSPAARRIVVENQLDATSIQGSGRDGRLMKGDALAAAANAEATATVPAPFNDASALAARLAQAAGLDLAAITGSGPSGRVLMADVDTARGVRPPSARLPAVPQIAPAQARGGLAEIGVTPGSYDLLPLDGMRKTIARRMVASFRDVPHFPLTIDVEVDELISVRARINDALAASGPKVSLNDMIIKAAAQALRYVPEANASYTPDGLAMHHHADIAVAVAVEGGLITPIIRAAETKGVGAIAAEMADLAERARTKRLRPEEYQGGTFSISNLGMFGVRSFSSIINEPQGAILSIGVAEQRPVVRKDELAIATVMSVTMTCDHRAMDGATGARFLQRLVELLRNPLLLLA